MQTKAVTKKGKIKKTTRKEKPEQLGRLKKEQKLK